MNIFLKNLKNENSVTLNTKTLNTNTEHLTYDTTFVPLGTPKQCPIETSSSLASPSAKMTSSNSNQKKLAALEAEADKKRLDREKAHKIKYHDFKADKNERRKQIQDIMDKTAIDLVRRTDDVFRIEVTTKRPRGNRCQMNIDILADSNTKWQRYVCKMQNSRPYDITSNVDERYRDWYGYDILKSSIKEGNFAGKMIYRQTSGKLSRIAPKLLPKTGATIHIENDVVVVTLLIGTKRYDIQLEQYFSKDNPASMKWFEMKGIFQKEDDYENLEV